jgi:hypothetical protein
MTSESSLLSAFHLTNSEQIKFQFWAIWATKII